MTDLAPHAYAEDARNPFGAGKNSGDTYKFELSLGTANLNAGDNFPLYKAAKDCWLEAPSMEFTDMDTHATGTLAFDLGTDSNDDAFMAAVDASAAGSSITPVATMVAVSAGDIISASVNTAAATAAAGTLTVGFKLRNR